MSEKLKTMQEVCSQLRVSKGTVYRWMNDGLISCVKIGGKLLFEQSEINRVIESNRENRAN